ncbi:hypothetical protein MCOR02_002389 [Pyricularia oryzae]|uniref:Uncharacterized protein n=4 Tax=Pyricularia oryzae TaxID=318829 RepID=G4MTH0_PYRO7|nr:uncharacterized protein MGG_15730 [Pyricularia oryzae 70-15]ELQ39445.1 hypothetical protein OOU_Y34scaffold00497g3 [Pyricularia oryzae Y34]KAH8838953.1 hypothetical protein MCOR01_008195 [Pyricularia oryzae]EHA54721.1 hypothetical protein MGG_15730 [Pyricularia oryzae 70-15]KAH9438788.1 hypothetical protein MCOR02_002389 [Pyricularia oryzae]KAI6254414.1 hypothetical protein MCOR19_009055 [Pyricularia oryzae]
MYVTTVVKTYQIGIVEPKSYEALESTTVMYADQIVGPEVKGVCGIRIGISASIARREDKNLAGSTTRSAPIAASWPTNYAQGCQQQGITTALEYLLCTIDRRIKIAKPGKEGTHRHALHYDLQNLETSTSLSKSNPCTSQSDLVSFKGIPRVRRSN